MTDAAAGSKTASSTSARRPTYQIPMKQPSQSARFPETGAAVKLFHTGTVLYSDMLIRFSFVNQYNPLEEDLLYIFNPLERRSFTDGLLCGISSTDLMPCAFKCFITLKPQELTDNLQQHLLFTRAELQRWKNAQHALNRQQRRGTDLKRLCFCRYATSPGCFHVKSPDRSFS